MSETTNDEITMKDIFLFLYKYKLTIISSIIIFTLFTGYMQVSVPQKNVYEVSSFIDLGYGDKLGLSANALQILLSDDFLFSVFNKIHPGSNNNEYASFKKQISVQEVKNSGNTVVISVFSSNKTEGTEITKNMVENYSNLGLEEFNRTYNPISENINENQERLRIVNDEINLTRSQLINISSQTSEVSSLLLSTKLLLLQNMENERVILNNYILTQQLLLVSMTPPKIISDNIDTIYIKSIEKENSKIMIIIAGILGFIVGVFIAFMQELLSKRNLGIQI